MTADGSRGAGEVVTAGVEGDVGPALVPPMSGDEPHVDTVAAQFAITLPPCRDDARVVDPQCPHERRT